MRTATRSACSSRRLVNTTRPALSTPWTHYAATALFAGRSSPAGGSFAATPGATAALIESRTSGSSASRPARVESRSVHDGPLERPRADRGRPHRRPRVVARERGALVGMVGCRADDTRPGPPRPADGPADPLDAAHAAVPAADEGAPEALQERPPQAERGAHEVLQGA